MVEYYDNDFSFEEHQIEMEQKLQSLPSSAETAEIDTTIDDDDRVKLKPETQAQCWDGFHTSHSTGKFFKPRRDIMKCFPCILEHCATEDSTQTERPKRLILEVGCGSGSSCLPILKNCTESTIILACDCSAKAVDVCKSVVQSSTDSKNFGAFVSDPSLECDESDTSFAQDVKTAHMKLLTDETIITNNDDVGLADIVLMVFVLSAVPPKRVPRFMKQIYDAVKCGGKVCFRDYALYDMPMMRFKETHSIHSTCCDSDGKSPRLYERGDGTCFFVLILYSS